MFDILIVGGGHAGVEAAYISSQFTSLKVGLVSMKGVGLASAPCNPSVGGVGKGQVVRELDSLGGLMGQLADRAGIQFRTLNESKGYAVQSTRIQIDKVRYSQIAEEILGSIPNISINFDKIISVDKDADSFVVKGEDKTYRAKKLIMTVGTFLNGKMHTGDVQSCGGREGCESSGSIGTIFQHIKTQSARFKTGTPARLDKTTINYDVLEEQASDASVYSFHFSHEPQKRFQEQVSCYLGYTTPTTMKVIRDNKELSPMFNGQIKGVGARYCPSIEDKAYRYPDKDVHHIFVEPESHDLNTVYPSGISTSLPKEVQEQMVASIKGLEDANIIKYGYAVEYDVVDTTQLDQTLEMKSIPGLYFAGQVNGTSGYEEAAGQGYIAGVNACLELVGQSPLILSRRDSYIGVMIEDLVSNLRDEPYRLFTARSENRLYIREDNAVLRMARYRKLLGLQQDIDNYVDAFENKFLFYMEQLKSLYVNPSDPFLKRFNIKVPRRTSLAEVIKQNSVDPIEVCERLFEYCGFVEDLRLIRTIAISTKYDGYINKSLEHSKRVDKLDDKKIDWHRLMDSENISFECKQRIEKIQPKTFGQLKLIEGIRPATLIAVAGSLN